MAAPLFFQLVSSAEPMSCAPLHPTEVFVSPLINSSPSTFKLEFADDGWEGRLDARLLTGHIGPDHVSECSNFPTDGNTGGC